MIVDCAAYVDGVRSDGTLDIVEAFEAGRAPDAFVWIGLYEPTDDEFVQVQHELSLHPLAVEDAVRAHQRPKLDVYSDSAFFVVKTARYDDVREVVVPGEIHVFIGDGFVVTIRHGDASPLTDVRGELERDRSRLRLGPGAVLYAVLDRVVDDYVMVVDGIENDIDELEAQVFSEVRNNPGERIFRLKREVLEFSRSVRALEEPLERLVRQLVPQVGAGPELHAYFRDVLDHTLRIAGRIETARETLGAALEANLAQISLRQNEDMRAMAGWAAMIAVPTLFAGIWGMNFEHMPELSWKIGYPLAIATIFGSGFFVRWKLRRNGWL